MAEVNLVTRQGYGLQAAAEVMERVFATFDDSLANQIEEMPTRNLGALLRSLETFGDCRAWALECSVRAVLARLPDARQWQAEVERLPRRAHVFHDVADQLLQLPPVRR